MKITICGSISNTPEMLNIIEQLQRIGHKTFWHIGMQKYAEGDKEIIQAVKENHARAKQEHNTIKWYYNSIKKSDAILVCNFKKNDIAGYIGGSVLMEIGFAHVHDKKIFLYNPLPEDPSFLDEIEAMYDEVINGDLEKIK